MKRKLLIFCALIFTINYSKAQLVTIGAGTSGSLYGPVYIFSSSSTNTHSWNMSIYTQSELLANGATAALINSIGWYKNDVGAYLLNDASFEIYIKNTSQADFGGVAADFNVESVGATLVYSSATSGLPASIGWVDYTFSTPFNWNGMDNIMVLTKWVRTGAGTAAVNWACVPGFSPARVSHSFSGTATMGSLYLNANLPNIRMNITPLGIHTYYSDCTFELYPNPATENVRLELSEFEGLCNIEISNLYGEVVYAEKTSQKSLLINLNDFAKGMYMLKINTKNQSAIKKLNIVK